MKMNEMSEPITATVTLICDVKIVINDPDVLTRVTGPGGDEWRSQLYNLRTEKDVFEHLAYNRLANGCENAKSLDGWADLPKEAVSMSIDRQSIEAREERS
jgi:hypothetical protein